MSTSDPMPPSSAPHTPRTAVLGLVLVVVLVYLLPLGLRPLFMPDETRYAEIPREMRESGDWVTPRLCGLRYFEKPPLGYWLNASCQAVFGENRFAVRLPSALAAGLTALLAGFLACRFGAGGLATGCLAALILLSMGEPYLLGVFAVLDGPFTCCVSAAVGFFYLAWAETRPGPRRGWLIATGAAMGLAFLAKGFLGFVLPGLVAVPFLVLQRDWKAFLRLSWLPVLAAVVVVLPWAVLIHQREPDFWRYFVVVEHLQRFLDSTGKAQHEQPWWFLLPIVAAGALPWLFLLPASLIGLRGRFSRPEVQYLLFWLLMPILFFSVSKGKLGTYVLPCFLPLAILLALGLERLEGESFRPWMRLAGWTMAAVALVGAVALTGWTFFAPPARYGPADRPCLYMALAMLVAWAVLAILAGSRRSRAKAFGFFAIGPLLLMGGLQVAPPVNPLKGKAPEAFLAEVKMLLKSSTILVSDGNLSPAVAWCLRPAGPILVIAEDDGELEYGLLQPEGAGRRVPLAELAARAMDSRRDRDLAVILTARKMRDFLPVLPAGGRLVEADGYALLRYPAP